MIVVEIPSYALVRVWNACARKSWIEASTIVTLGAHLGSAGQQNC